MEYYANNGGNSGVSGYSIASDSITVYFNDGAAYLYTNASAGAANIQQMIQLARAGSGLNSFISTRVKKGYSRRIR